MADQYQVPSSTYRFQFHSKFRIEEAKGLIEYLNRLGISDVYSSPLLAARLNSTHCYDTVDHSRLNPQITTDEEFIQFSKIIKDQEMGLLLDIVPNHIGINSDPSTTNSWWLDVMENGQSSKFAKYFDIDWNRKDNQGKVFVPFLGKPLGQAVEDGEIKVTYDSEKGSFKMSYWSLELPLSTSTYATILKFASNLKIDSSNNLPNHNVIDESKKNEREQKSTELKRDLKKLTESDNEAKTTILKAIEKLSENKDILYELINSQPYRLCYWKVAADEVNYRRFFEINDLMAVRVEDEQVFKDAHDLVFKHVKEGRITGLRIDHPDGLHDPETYFAKLQDELNKIDPQKQNRFYLLIEKILEPGEKLNQKCAVDGTTGYEFMNQLNWVFVDTTNENKFKEFYEGKILNSGTPQNFEDLLYNCKKLILNSSMESELSSVSNHIFNIAKSRRKSADFSLKQIKSVLAEVVACFPVYRTYITTTTNPSATDKEFIKKTFEILKERNPLMDGLLVEFIESIFLCNEDGITEEEKKSRRIAIMRLQQLTGPIMAKGLEDTAFYRYFLLTSLNEVGGQPDRFGITTEQFHQENVYRATSWPNTMSSTSTHDTKRSEDVRARINVLSEIPERFQAELAKWDHVNSKYKKIVKGLGRVPHNNEEYMIYQTLIGAWPFQHKAMSKEEKETFKGRITSYLSKCIKESKSFTSWTALNQEYEDAIKSFAESIIDDQEFLKDFLKFQEEISSFGKLNSLSQTVLKLTSPGMPDIYQGTELFDFSLVDPDNRRPVDYALRKKMLDEIQSKDRNANCGDFIIDLFGRKDEGSIKLFVMERVLNFRKSHKAIFRKGQYTPLEVEGERKKNVIAFSRKFEEKECIVVVGRFFAELEIEAGKNPIGDVWKNTNLKTSGKFRDVLSGTTLESKDGLLHIKDIFLHLPVCVLEKIQ